MPWTIDNVQVERTGRNENVLLTQHFFKLDGEARDLQPRLDVGRLAKGGAPDCRNREQIRQHSIRPTITTPTNGPW